MAGIVFDIKRGSVKDGPGLRTSVFLKGCPLRCVWCHNPESQAAAPQWAVTTGEVCGREMSVDAVMADVLADRPFYGTEGGVTLTGGEPTAQPDFAVSLAAAARAAGVPVFVVPGPTAAISALVLSGFPTDRFTFCGFFDEKKLRDDNKIRHTIIYYESPNRIMATIAAMARVMPERQIAIVREITKIHEEAIIGYPAELMNIEPPRGEIVIVVAPAPEYKMSDSEITEIVNDIVANSTKSAAADLAARAGISKKEAYRRMLAKGDAND